MSSAQDTEELSLDFDDIQGPVTLPVLRDRVEEIVQENLVYRDAFRSYDATNIASNVVQIPVPENDGAHPKIVEEGAEFPRSHEEYRLEELEFDKFGFEVPLTMEAVEDSRIDLTQDQIDRQARQMAEDINARAFEEVVDSIDPINQDADSTVDRDDADPDGTMTYDDVLDGRQELVANSYDPDLMIADVEAVHDLLKADNFLRATEIGDTLRRDGAIGRIAGMEVMEDDSGLPITRDGSDPSNPGVLMVDTDLWGYEGERTPITTEEYTEERNQTDVYRIFSRMGWLVTEDEAGAIVEG